LTRFSASFPPLNVDGLLLRTATAAGMLLLLLLLQRDDDDDNGVVDVADDRGSEREKNRALLKHQTGRRPDPTRSDRPVGLESWLKMVKFCGNVF